MAGRRQATAEEIAEHVHDSEETSQQTIHSNVKRTNDSLANMGSRLAFRFVSGVLYPEISHE